MDVVLVQPRGRLGRIPVNRTGRVRMPESLLAIATVLDAAGYKVKLIDQRLDPYWEQTLLDELRAKPIFVGTTAMTGPQIAGALKVSQFVKENSDVPVVWGGIHPTLLPRQTLENEYVDIVVQEEGEETILDLVKALSAKRSLDSVLGIWWKNGGVISQNPPRPYIDLNRQPPCNYDLVDLDRYAAVVAGYNCLPIETSRGCAYDCAFCYNTRFHRQQWRHLTPEETLLRMKLFIDRYKVPALIIRDDNFFSNPVRAQAILEGMVRQNLNVVWGKGDIRLDTLARLDDDYLRLIEKSKCLNLVVGIESGSQRVADLIRKNIDVSKAPSINRKLARYNFHVHYTFLLGIPGETTDDLRESASLMAQLTRENPRATLGVQKYVPYPATDLFDISVQRGLIAPQKLEDWITYGWMNRDLDFPWLSPDHLRLIRMMSFCGMFLTQKSAWGTYLNAAPFILLGAKAYSPIARQRFKGMHYRFFPEIKIARMLGYKGY